MRHFVFYLGLSMLFTHEMDAMSNHEWRVLPILRSLSESAGETTFLLAHVPLFALTIGFVASLNPRTRRIAQKVVSGFLIVHAALHFAFSGHPDYAFSGALSNILIAGAALCGAAHFPLLVLGRRDHAT